MNFLRSINLILKISKKKSQSTKNNIKHINIYLETKTISSYLDESINNFNLLFQNKLKDFDEVLEYLETIGFTKKCISDSYLENACICRNSSKVNYSIIFNTSHKNSKHLHKG